MPRGRPPAPTDDAAIAARAEVEDFMRINNLRPSRLGELAGVKPSTAARVLAKSPATWSTGFTEIVNFVNSQKSGGGDLVRLAGYLRGDRETARAAAALLRAVAALLERS